MHYLTSIIGSRRDGPVRVEVYLSGKETVQWHLEAALPEGSATPLMDLVRAYGEQVAKSHERKMTRHIAHIMVIPSEGNVGLEVIVRYKNVQ